MARVYDCQGATVSSLRKLFGLRRGSGWVRARVRLLRGIQRVQRGMESCVSYKVPVSLPTKPK